MVLKLYGHDISTCTTRVACVLNEKNVPFEFVFVDLAKGEQKSEEFIKAQPFGAVPYIDDEGFILYESRAICWYIESKYPDQGTRLLPTDLKERARAMQAISIETAAFDSAGAPYLYEKKIKPIMGAPVDEDWAATCRAKLSKNLDVYEKILSKQKYLAGDTLTLADLYHLSIGTGLPGVGCDEIEKRPAVAKWFNEIAARPSWQALGSGIKSTAA